MKLIAKLISLILSTIESREVKTLRAIQEANEEVRRIQQSGFGRIIPLSTEQPSSYDITEVSS